ncbi:MAG: hypothetical protein Q9N34_09480 [Aquificota bacterium]|nr:hypothetical protein [Aquificota bacterium]
MGRYEESLRGIRIDWNYLIEGLVFEALQRAVLTDIKPQVFHRLLRESEEGDKQLSTQEGWRFSEGV